MTRCWPALSLSSTWGRPAAGSQAIPASCSRLSRQSSGCTRSACSEPCMQGARHFSTWVVTWLSARKLVCTGLKCGTVACNFGLPRNSILGLTCTPCPALQGWPEAASARARGNQAQHPHPAGSPSFPANHQSAADCQASAASGIQAQVCTALCCRLHHGFYSAAV